ncbi:MAG: hypothetical protein L0Z50_39725 [Verrucomicrobiales bacterium]|nr:hypothetical protein [Verrucomicrobiales bacterium]
MRNIVALLLLVFWPLVSSHPLLQYLGLIHVVHADHSGGNASHEHNADNHAAADGGYVAGSNSTQLTKPLLVTSVLPFTVALLLAAICLNRLTSSSGRAPPGVAPPDLRQRWQFSFRAALPPRAPSFAS